MRRDSEHEYRDLVLPVPRQDPFLGLVLLLDSLEDRSEVGTLPFRAFKVELEDERNLREEAVPVCHRFPGAILMLAPDLFDDARTLLEPVGAVVELVARPLAQQFLRAWVVR